MFVLRTWNKKGKCPAFGKTCTNCFKKEPFSRSVQTQKEKRWKVEENEANIEVFSGKTKTRM